MFTYFVIFLVLVFLSIAGIGVRRGYSQSSSNKPVTSKTVTDSSRSQLNDMLKHVEKKEAPAKKMGAMCYKPSMSPVYQEYVCPIDGEKTVYDSKNYDTYYIVRSIVEMRRLVERINTLTDLAVLSLDEKRLCHKETPNLESAERFVSLVAKYPDKKEHVYNKVIIEDLRILLGFFEKKLTYTTDNDGELPLKEQLGKVREMLGVTE